MQVQYVTDEQGQRTGVLLDVAAYQRLIGEKPTDPDLLIDMSRAELEALAASSLTLASQTRLEEFLAQQKEGVLGEAEMTELDKLLVQIDQLNLLKTRAKYTLAQTSSIP